MDPRQIQAKVICRRPSNIQTNYLALDIEAVVDILKKGQITQGKTVEDFGQALADYAGARYGVAVSSGTAALHISVASLGIGHGDEVITTPLSWIITTNAIAACNAKPIFADVQDDFNIDPISIENKMLTRTKIINREKQIITDFLLDIQLKLISCVLNKAINNIINNDKGI